MKKIIYILIFFFSFIYSNNFFHEEIKKKDFCFNNKILDIQYNPILYYKNNKIKKINNNLSLKLKIPFYKDKKDLFSFNFFLNRREVIKINKNEKYKQIINDFNNYYKINNYNKYISFFYRKKINKNCDYYFEVYKNLDYIDDNSIKKNKIKINLFLNISY